MAKKKEKGKKSKDSAGPRDALRGAVETSFQKAAGGASRAQELLDDIASTLKSLRDANLVETLEGVREEVQSLAKRVAALELRGGESAKPAATRRASASTTRRPAARNTTASSTTTAARKPASRKSTSAAKPAARKSTSAAKPAARKSTSAAKPAARKTTAAKKPAARKPATPRKSS